MLLTQRQVGLLCSLQKPCVCVCVLIAQALLCALHGGQMLLMAIGHVLFLTQMYVRCSVLNSVPCTARGPGAAHGNQSRVFALADVRSLLCIKFSALHCTGAKCCSWHKNCCMATELLLTAINHVLLLTRLYVCCSVFNSVACTASCVGADADHDKRVFAHMFAHTAAHCCLVMQCSALRHARRTDGSKRIEPRIGSS